MINKEFDFEVSQSLRRYFKTLSQYGYKSYNEVYILIVLLYIGMLISGELNINISSEEFSKINKVLECFSYNTCMVNSIHLNHII